jgi:hypothetical protein
VQRDAAYNERVSRKDKKDLYARERSTNRDVQLMLGTTV